MARFCVQFVVTCGLNRLVADSGNNRVRVISGPTSSPTPVTTRTLGGTGVAGATEGSPVSTATFKEPRSVVCDVAGSRYIVADSGNNKIRAIPFTGNSVTIAGQTNSGWAGLSLCVFFLSMLLSLL